mgnify:CR=1 FL=1
MADIRSYLKEKEKREQKLAEYKEKLAKNKRNILYRTLLITAALAVLVIFISIQFKYHIYTEYEIVASVEREAVGGALDMRLGNAILTYSKDGAHCTDARGNVKWNQTFEIQDIRMAVSGTTAAIGEYNGRNIYLADAEKLFGEIATAMPIQNLAVSQNGYVTAILNDTDVTWIYTYNSSGELKYEGQAKMDNSGYPMAVGLSPNGELLCVSYVYLDAGVLKTNVAFYNFGSVGENVSDHLISTFFYPDLVPYVGFLDDDTAFAVGDGRVMIYSGGRKPVVEMERLYDREIHSVFHSDRYVGLVFLSEDSEHRYRIDVYDAAASKMRSFYFDMDYTDIFFEKDTMVIYNETQCQIMTMDGIEKFNGSFSKPVRLMLPTGKAYRYLLVTDSSIDTIQLK